MRRLRRAFVALAIAAFLCARASNAGQPASAPLLLISLDAFRWDYVASHPDETPNLRQLMREGVSARALIPVFPTLTFTNHYSIVTGLYPANHGIIANSFFDPQLGQFFNYRLPTSVRDNRWWGGEPIWITAVRQGLKSACYFWPGSEAELSGFRPTLWKSFDYSIPFAERLNTLLSWLALPADQRPAIIAFYLEETNSAGHYFGARSAEVTAAIKLLDERLGAIMERAKAEALSINFVVVSDHGMADTDGATKTMMIDDFVDVAKVQVDFDGPIAGLRVPDDNVAAIIEKLHGLPPQYHVYRAGDLPAHLRTVGNPRIPPIWIIPDEGWRIQLRSRFISTRDSRLKGDHGYDSATPSMHGILIACGPAFKNEGRVIEPVENIHIYNLLCAAIGLKPAPNDGDDRLVKAALRQDGPVR